MSLDITAYRKLVVVDRSPDVEAEGNEVRFSSAVVDWTEKNWPGRTAGVLGGALYEASEHFDFCAGSYSGYGRWRDWLARLTGWGSAKLCWDTGEAGPFLELIDFADNEGVIGSVVAAKLLNDFKEWDERIAAACAATGERENLGLFIKWRRAFEMAADGGAVDFH